MKIDRLLSIVIMLLNRKRVTAKELAEHFEVSIRTIQRDIESINMAGIPIVSYRGQYGGYGLLENYKIDKNFLSHSEHRLLVTALEGINKVYEDRDFASIIEKLTYIKNISQSIDTFNSDDRIIMDFSPWFFPEGLKYKINNLKKSILEKKLIELSYIDLNGNTTNRTVEPAVLALKLSQWYLYGFCRLRQDFRLFKITRIRNLTFTNEEFKPRKHDYQFNFSFPQENEIKIKLKFDQGALHNLDNYFELDKLDFNEDGYIYAIVECAESEWVYSMILSFGDSVEIIEPKHIRKIIKDQAKKVFDKY